MSEVLLYDLPSKGRCACWSLNPWKTRMVLNYKEIPYKTEFIDYPDIAPTFKPLGLPPNENGTPYTIPAIRDANGNYIMDSRKIAHELEKQYPKPSLHLDSPKLPRVEELYSKFLRPLLAVVLPLVPGNLLREPSAEYFQRTRAQAFGMPLAQFEKEQGGDKAWEAATSYLKELGDMLRAEGGPFVLGKTVSYADIVIVSFLHSCKCIDDRIFGRLVEIEPALKKLYDASLAWLERDSH